MKLKNVFLLLIVLFLFISFSQDNNVVEINKLEEVNKYIKENNYSNYCILVDFSKSTSSKRFILYNIETNQIIYSCKCAHGNDGSQEIEADINSFSNEVNSHKSSLGKFKIGNKRTINSIDGIISVKSLKIPCYELHGLDKTNSNAYIRGILIHPDYFLSNYSIPILPGHSFGCFSIPKKSFDIISNYIDKETKPVLLISYYI